MNKLNITISIDDIHPEIGWGCDGDKCVEYLRELNKEFGCKFVLFIPSNYHGMYPLSKNKDWVNYWRQYDWVEMAAHGHFHDRKIIDPNCRECEFIELDYENSEKRIMSCLNEWYLADYRPIGWRMPGWLSTQDGFSVVQGAFKYVAIHENLNDGIKLSNIKIFKGAVSISSKDSITFTENNIHFQSHINGLYNSNNWNEINYLNFKNILLFLKESYSLNFKLFKEFL